MDRQPSPAQCAQYCIPAPYSCQGIGVGYAEKAALARIAIGLCKLPFQRVRLFLKVDIESRLHSLDMTNVDSLTG